MNVSRTMLALWTLASEHEEISEEMALEVEKLLEGATHVEIVSLVTSMANVQNYALTLLEQYTRLSKDDFLRDLGVSIAQNEEG